MGQTRRAFLTTASLAVTTAITGCSASDLRTAAADAAGLATPKPVWTFSGRNTAPAIEGQPNLDNTPTAWGTLAHTPTEAEQFDWEILSPVTEGTAHEVPIDIKTFDPATEFVVAIVGAVPFGYALQNTEAGTQWEDASVTYNLELYQAIRSSDGGTSTPTPEEGEPKRYFDYTINIYDANGEPIPDSIEVNFHE